MRLVLCLCMLSSFMLQAQDKLTIAFLLDDATGRGELMELGSVNEINSLLRNRFELEYVKKSYVFGERGAEIIDSIYADPNIDIVVAAGFVSSIEVAKKNVYNKPTILAFVLDSELQGLEITPEGTSGVNNLTYIQSPFDIERDIETLFKIKPFKKMAFIGDDVIDDFDFDFDGYYQSILDKYDANYTYYAALEQPDNLIGTIADDVEVAFVFPMDQSFTNDQIKSFYDGLADRGIPAFSLLSSPELDLGAYAAYQTDENVSRIPRRVAINVLKITEGMNASAIPVSMETFTEDLMINMRTVNRTNHYPNWEVMADAILLNITTAENTERQLTFKSAIIEGLENNLQLSQVVKGAAVVEKDIKIAKSNLLPTIDASGSVSRVDDNTVRNSFGTRGRFSMNATGNLSQVVINEPVLANIAIQKLLYESEQQVVRQNELDVVQSVASTYLSILQAIALVQLQNENVSVTRQNYNIAKTKENVGYAGVNDVYRFESELANNNIELNNALANLEAAKYSLNNLLNRDIKEPFTLADIELTNDILFVMDERLLALIENPNDVDVFTDFMVGEAFANLPEIKQIDANLAAQRRNLLSQQRAFFLPTLGLQGQYNLPIDNWGYPEGVVPLDNFKTHSVALGLSFPIFQGGERNIDVQKSKISVAQIEDQRANLYNQLELQVRANMAIASASFNNMDLARQSATAAGRNFEIAQDNYQQGLLNITSLIDAQNALLGANINATNAVYTFVTDFINVERAVGSFYFLSTEAERDAFFQRFVQNISN